MSEYTVCNQPREIERLEYEDIGSLTGYCISTSILNNTDIPIIIGTRDGFRATLNPVNIRKLEPGLYFKLHHRFSPTVTFDIDHKLRVPENPWSQFSEIRSPGRKPTDVREMASLFRITSESLYEYGGGYNRLLDLVIDTGDNRYGSIHPYSSDALDFAVGSTREERLQDGVFGLKMFLVDNYDTFGDKYINFGGLVHQIKAVHNLSYDDGLYISSTNELKLNGSVAAPKPKFYSLKDLNEDKSPVMLFNSYKEAKAYGDLDSIKERKRKELEHENTIQKLESERLSLEEKRKHEAIIRDIEAREAYRSYDREGQSQARKDYYDSRSAMRKDSSELWKIIPVAIGGAIVLKKLLFD